MQNNKKTKKLPAISNQFFYDFKVFKRSLILVLIFLRNKQLFKIVLIRETIPEFEGGNYDQTLFLSFFGGEGFDVCFIFTVTEMY